MKSLILIAVSMVALSAQANLEIKSAGAMMTQSAMQPQQRLSHYFGIVDINSYNYVDFIVTNRGDMYLGYEGAFISGIDYRARTNCNSGLMPGQQCQFTIVYNPFFEGYHSGLFELYFSNNNEILVDTWGEARRRW